MVLKVKTGLLARFRRGNKNVDNTVAKPESAVTPKDKSESQTLVDDADSVPDNINNNSVGIKGGGDTTSQLKAVRFPANDALKTTPVRGRRELQKPPTAREAAYGGPPRYDWIDIVSASYSL